ncbi:hypothetical protein T4D_12448 [Trichinella pseudospiralis]|uniref:Uncharacterized protein n=1 Tax=Trichinella pseudospiralis TaxID=6337 RepID=A0A0V1FU41_TRIPS|nr:hypothetical protein T4D_12448 [Trichinella pseudospiralis]
MTNSGLPYFENFATERVGFTVDTSSNTADVQRETGPKFLPQFMTQNVQQNFCLGITKRLAILRLLSLLYEASRAIY